MFMLRDCFRILSFDVGPGLYQTLQNQHQVLATHATDVLLNGTIETIHQ